jgi:hypothetical protein
MMVGTDADSPRFDLRLGNVGQIFAFDVPVIQIKEDEG